jgi:hypothetical protein
MGAEANYGVQRQKRHKKRGSKPTSSSSGGDVRLAIPFGQISKISARAGRSGDLSDGSHCSTWARRPRNGRRRSAPALTPRQDWRQSGMEVSAVGVTGGVLKELGDAVAISPSAVSSDSGTAPA